MQTFEAVNGKTGKLMWTYKDADADAGGDAGGSVDVMNLYTGQFVDDVNGDGVPDIVNVHGGDPFAEPGQIASPSSAALIMIITRSSADADNRLDAFSSQSRSTNMVPFGPLRLFAKHVIGTTH